MKKSRKNLINILILLSLCGATFWLLLKDQDLPAILNSMREAKPGYLILGVIFVIVFVCSESVIIHYMMRSLNKNTKLHRCIKYSFIGFFFSCITPSATGGQPAQVYYMKKDGLEIPVSTLVLMIVTIGYKFVLVLIGLILLFFYRDFVITYLGNTRVLLYLGLVMNIFCVVAMLMLVFWPNLAKRIVTLILNILEKFRLFKKISSHRERFLTSMDKYHEAAGYFLNHKLVIFNVLLISIFQRLCLFFVTYLVYRSFGLAEYGPWMIVLLQASVSISVDMLPLPGGMGISESLFMANFGNVFTSKYLLSGLLLSRGISYYALLLISAAVTLGAHLFVIRKEKKENYLER